KDKITTWVPSSLTTTSGLRPRQEVDIDRPGADFFNYAIPAAPAGSGTASAAICAGACGLDDRCKSYTFFNGRCFLKTIVPVSVPLPGAISGVKLPTETATDRAGGDYNSFVSTIANCAKSCAGDARCLSFSFSGGVCFLKESIPFPTANSGV